MTDAILPITASDRFSLTERFLEQYDHEPPWGPLGKITYLRTYSRLKSDGTRENWRETVQRVVEGTYTIQKAHCRHLNLPWSGHKAQRSAQEMYDRIFTFKFTPPGRGLWMMGTDYVYKRGGAALNNCAFVSTQDIDSDFADPFCFLMDMSMLGLGVGFDTRGANQVRIAREQQDSEPFIVEDSREGWTACLARVLEGFRKGSLPEGIDYSPIRPEGSPIASFGGVSAGPDPLIKCITTIYDILNGYRGHTVDSSAIVDISNVVGKCVVSGNVRRTAEVALGEPNDEKFLTLKRDKKKLAEWRWASNNSIIIDKPIDYNGPAAYTKVNGEPGYFWINNVQQWGRYPGDGYTDEAIGSNPCLEQSLESHEVCCLVESFQAHHEDYEDYARTLKCAYLYAKTVTLVPTHHARTNAVMLRNRRIGTSQSGIVQAINRMGTREFFERCDRGYGYVRELDRSYSRWFCIPQSVKVTSVKPSGTVSLLCGATPGIHYPYAEYYYRTIRFASNDPLVEQLQQAGYRVEKDKAADNSSVVFFAVAEKDYQRGRDQVTMWEQMELAAQMQRWWADNQVSVTVTFKPEEADDIPRALALYENRLKSVSFLPLTDHGYEQAPYIAITKKEYEKYQEQLKPTDLVPTFSFAGGTGCDGGTCELPT